MSCTVIVRPAVTRVRVTVNPQGPPGPQGPGDLVGPASSTDNAVALYDGTTGKLLQDSNAILASDKLTGIKTITFAEHDNGDSGATKTVSADNGQKQKLRLTADCAITAVRPTLGEGAFRLRLIMDGVGGHTTTWVGGKFPGTPANTSALTANQYTLAAIDFDDDNNTNIQIPKDSSDNALPFT